jgi:hypothetical protein
VNSNKTLFFYALVYKKSKNHFSLHVMDSKNADV